MVGTKIINKALTSHDYRGASKGYHDMEERPTLGQSCWGHCRSPVVAQAKSKVISGAASSIHQGGTVEVQKFQLNDVKGLVCTTQKVTIPPFSTINRWANTSVKGHCMRVHVLTELALGLQLPAAVVPTRYLWGTTPLFFKGTSMTVQSECLCCGCAP